MSSRSALSVGAKGFLRHNFNTSSSPRPLKSVKVKKKDNSDTRQDSALKPKQQSMCSDFSLNLPEENVQEVYFEQEKQRMRSRTYVAGSEDFRNNQKLAFQTEIQHRDKRENSLPSMVELSGIMDNSETYVS